jgi:hypothetical protein
MPAPVHTETLSPAVAAMPWETPTGVGALLALCGPQLCVDVVAQLLRIWSPEDE